MKLNEIETKYKTKSIKFLLSSITTIFIVTGVILLMLGIAVLTTYNNYHLFITDIFFTLTNYVIATAVIIFFTSILGFYGATSEKYNVIAGYAALLLTILIFEISITILAFDLSFGRAYDELHYPMANTLQQYGKMWDVTVAWDNLHGEFQCCGMYGFEWESNQLPVSCCPILRGTMSPFVCTTANSYGNAYCLSYLSGWIGYKAYIIGCTVAFITCVQGIITSVAAWQAYRAKYQNVLLEKAFKYGPP